MLDWTQIIVALITICVPATVTLLTSNKLRRQANKHSTRSDIMQLIIEDHVRDIEGKLPENYQAILDTYDEYKDSGGNSYIHSKVEEYVKWYEAKNKKGDNHVKKSR